MSIFNNRCRPWPPNPPTPPTFAPILQQAILVVIRPGALADLLVIINNNRAFTTVITDAFAAELVAAGYPSITIA
jgi:hypothetical protein